MATQIARIGSLSTRQLEDLILPLLNTCTTTKHLSKIHAHIIKSSLSHSNYLSTKIIQLCSTFRAPDYASSVFRHVAHPNTFLYNAMIRLCSYSNEHDLGISLFKEMIMAEEESETLRPDRFTYPFVIKCCGGGKSVGQVHGIVWRVGLVSNLTIGNALVDMYGRFGGVGDARKVFDEMPERNVVSWNCLLSGLVRAGRMRRAREVFDGMGERSEVSWTAMISGYVGIGCYGEAVGVFQEMLGAGVVADEASVVSVLPGCARLGALEMGKWVHFYCERSGLVRRTIVCNALIEMYCSCGCIEEARRVFGGMCERDVISWSTMISGLANHGKGNEASNLFQEMRRTKIKPNGITFVAIISACVHSGLLDQGLQYFESMKNEYNIEPSIHHYSCLVDLLGRSGQLNRALGVIEKMPMRPDAKIWGSLLSSCRTHRNLDVAEIAMERLQEFEPDDTGNYVMLSNIYADLGQWDGVSRIRKLIRSKSLKKVPGSSSIEVENIVREFISGDDSKSFSIDMCWVLEILQLHLSKRSHSLETIPDDNAELF